MKFNNRLVGLAILVVALCGCASSGSIVTTRSGPDDLSEKMAEVVIRTDIQVTKAGADVPTAITRTNQIAFFDPKTREMLKIPDGQGRGGTMDIIRSWSFESTDTMMMRILPAVLNTATGVVGQGMFGLKLAREQARLNAECVKAGTCLQGPSTVVNAVAGSTSQALIEGVALQTLINLGCATSGNCSPPVPNGPPSTNPTPSTTPTPAGGN